MAEHGKEEEVWQTLIHEKVCSITSRIKQLVLIFDQRPPKLRVRGLFIENLSGPILQMLGTK